MYVAKDVMEKGMELTKRMNGLSLRGCKLSKEDKPNRLSDSDVPSKCRTSDCSPRRNDPPSAPRCVNQLPAMGNSNKKHAEAGNQEATDDVIPISEKFNRFLWCKSKLPGHRLLSWSPINGQYGFLKSAKNCKKGRFADSLQTKVLTMTELLMDETFLDSFFSVHLDFEDRCLSAQVCRKWRDVLYNPKYWVDVIPVWNSKKLNKEHPSCQKQFFQSIIGRGMNSMCFQNSGDEDVRNFVTSYPQSTCFVKHLVLKSCHVTDRGFEMLSQCFCNANQVEIIGCNEITESGLWSSLIPKTTSLHIADCISVTDGCIAAICQSLTSLQELSLQAYHVTDGFTSSFTACQSECLRVLRLKSCWEITNHGVTNLVRHLPNLLTLGLSGCSKVTDDGVEVIAEALKNLRSLDLSWCPRLTDVSLESIACDLPQLEELILDRCAQVTDAGIGYLSTILTLRKLYLRWCVQIRDFGLQHLSTMRNLQVLSVAGCSLITASGISCLSHLRSLQELELTNCPACTEELVGHLRRSLPCCVVIS